ncbi:unnamed protein product [Amoebophrya sp. A25]|nr:unnamed protein product [Amoebophrya sp. A25]|eukprot:GSA25T00002429001.1
MKSFHHLAPSLFIIVLIFTSGVNNLDDEDEKRINKLGTGQLGTWRTEWYLQDSENQNLKKRMSRITKWRVGCFPLCSCCVTCCAIEAASTYKFLKKLEAALPLRPLQAGNRKKIGKWALFFCDFHNFAACLKKFTLVISTNILYRRTRR